MSMPKALAFFGILAASAGASIAMTSCSSSTGVTPDCVNNVNDAGFIYPAQNGCYSFAACNKGSAENCCVDPKGVPFTGNMLAECLYGYGACAQFIVTADSSGNTTETCSSVVVAGSTGSSSSGGGGAGGGAPSGGSGAGGGNG